MLLGSLLAAERIASFDVAVVLYLGERGDAADLLDRSTRRDTSLVLLEQWGEDSDAISCVADATGWPECVGQQDGGSPHVSYHVETDHPILARFGPDAAVPIHEGEYADHAWFEGADGAIVLASVGDGSGTSGAALAVDEERNLVLAAALGRSRYVSDDAHTTRSDHLLAGAVTYLTESRSIDDAASNGTQTTDGGGGDTGSAAGDDAVPTPGFDLRSVAGTVLMLLGVAGLHRATCRLEASRERSSPND